ncbi:hypothetical protein [Streptococcus bovimastitidis]|uniref:hypothetical protein n=1 Tax=Streptococcus bovimastitidis TaxID=1856638 RepID=UPI001F0B4E69|nr:hypothetical protein [Streptococcus bovimastitidis]
MPAIVKKYGLKSTYQISAWVKKYQAYTTELSLDLRGSGRKPKIKKINLEEMTLEEQNAYLRMENDILKSLRALQKKYHYCRQGELNEKARHVHKRMHRSFRSGIRGSYILTKCT